MAKLQYSIPVEFAEPVKSSTAGKVPVKLTARTSDPAMLWGVRIVHDFSGMVHKPRIGLDLEHDPEKLVGYADDIAVHNNTLYISGMLTPTEGSPYIADMVEKMAAGIPYEASIHTAAREDDLEWVEKGTVIANGREYSAPVVVVREWTLRACAICARGRDSGTSAMTLSMSEENRAALRKFIEGKQQMTEDTTTKTPAVQPEPDATAADTPPVPTELAEPGTATDSGAAVDPSVHTPVTDPAVLELAAAIVELSAKFDAAEAKWEARRLAGGTATLASEPAGATGGKFKLAWNTKKKQ